MSLVSKISLDFILKQLYGGKKVIVGFSGPQGSGKTFNCTEISSQLNKMGHKTFQFSMDDFYLTFEEQNELQKQFPEDWMLNGRGLPGTHDLKLLHSCMEGIRKGDTVDIPKYDKSQNGGKGDRMGYVSVDFSAIEIVIFEGWFNGYVHIPSEEKLLEKWKPISSRFEQVKIEDILRLNHNLSKYYEIWELFDCFICVKTDDINNVYKWREQQEHDLISKKGSGMTDKQVKQFVDRYMPMYWMYYQRLELMQNMVPSKEIVIDIARNVK